MRKPILIGIVSLAALGGCGLDGFFGNVGHSAYPRPASKISGSVAWTGATSPQFSAVDGAGVEIVPFQSAAQDGRYEMRLPSATYSMIRAQGRAGGLLLRAIVPSVGEESAVVEDLDARDMTEALIVEAWLSANGKSFSQLTPAAYAGDGVSTGTRTLIRRDMDDPAEPAHALLAMVERLITRPDTASGQVDPDLFVVPVLDASYGVITSPIVPGVLARNPFDYDADGIADIDSLAFDAKLSEVAPLYSPVGCPDPANVRLVFSVDFNQGALSGTCGAINRFKWATDKPGKSMFFVGWVHEESPIQDPVVNARLGAGVPNQLQMYDDGTHGDEVAGDGIWTTFFDVPRGVRVGYKYTWGTRGQGWTGSEEWPGNSRILEVVDVNGDQFVHRRDVFGDEATNKDRMNLNPASGGTVTWTTDLRGCGAEAHEQRVTLHSACGCGEWLTPRSIGPLTLACPAGQ